MENLVVLNVDIWLMVFKYSKYELLKHSMISRYFRSIFLANKNLLCTGIFKYNNKIIDYNKSYKVYKCIIANTVVRDSDYELLDKMENCENKYINYVSYGIYKNKRCHTEDCCCHGNAMIDAVQQGNIDMVKFLAENDMDLTYNDYEYLKIAVYFNRVEIFKYIFEYIEYVYGEEIMDVEESLISIACFRGRFRIVKYLVETEVELEDSILHACHNGNLSIICYLIENGADLTHDPCCIMHNIIISKNKRLSEESRLDLIKYVFDCNPLTTISLETHSNLLNILKERNHTKILDYLHTKFGNMT
jgi:hypothetical protein